MKAKQFKMIQVIEVSENGSSRVIQSTIKPMDSLEDRLELMCSLLEDRLNLLRYSKTNYIGFKTGLMDTKFIVALIPKEENNCIAFCIDKDLAYEAQEAYNEADGAENEAMRIEKDSPNNWFPGMLEISFYIDNNECIDEDDGFDYFLSLIRAIELGWPEYVQAIKDKEIERIKGLVPIDLGSRGRDLTDLTIPRLTKDSRLEPISFTKWSVQEDDSDDEDDEYEDEEYDEENGDDDDDDEY